MARVQRRSTSQPREKPTLGDTSPSVAKRTKIHSQSYHRHVDLTEYTRYDLQKVLGGSGGLFGWFGSWAEQRDIKWEADDATFQRSLATAYSRGPLCHEVNRALYTNDDSKIEKFAPYIQMFREGFKSGAFNAYDGKLFRRMTLATKDQERYKIDTTVCWEPFSSCTYDEGWLKNFGNSQFEIRCYGAVDAHSTSKYYVPCLIQEHVLECFKYQKEVVMPPFCEFRVVQVREDRGGKRIYLETTQFPSVWQSIKDCNANALEQWGAKNTYLMSTSGGQASIVNEVAKSAVAKASDACADMVKICVDYGSPLSEIDPITGSNPLLILAEGISAASSGHTCLSDIAKTLVTHGANPNVPHKHTGKTVASVAPSLHKDLEEERLRPMKWQYWVDDGVAGKSTGWYDYNRSASRPVDAAFTKWLADGSCSEMLVNGGNGFSYEVNFSTQTQRNTSTSKVRRIRRQVDDSSGSGCSLQ